MLGELWWVGVGCWWLGVEEGVVYGGRGGSILRGRLVEGCLGFGRGGGGGGGSGSGGKE